MEKHEEFETSNSDPDNDSDGSQPLKLSNNPTTVASRRLQMKKRGRDDEQLPPLHPPHLHKVPHILGAGNTTGVSITAGASNMVGASDTAGASGMLPLVAIQGASNTAGARATAGADNILGTSGLVGAN